MVTPMNAIRGSPTLVKSRLTALKGFRMSVRVGV